MALKLIDGIECILHKTYDSLGTFVYNNNTIKGILQPTNRCEKTLYIEIHHNNILCIFTQQWIIKILIISAPHTYTQHTNTAFPSDRLAVMYRDQSGHRSARGHALSGLKSPPNFRYKITGTARSPTEHRKCTAGYRHGAARVPSDARLHRSSGRSAPGRYVDRHITTSLYEFLSNSVRAMLDM